MGKHESYEITREGIPLVGVIILLILVLAPLVPALIVTG